MGLRGSLELEATLDELDTLLLDFATELLDITTELLDFAELLDCTATEEHDFMLDELDGVCDELEDFAKLELDMADDDKFMELLEITLEELVESAELEGLVLLDRFSVEDDDVVALEDDKLTELLEILLDELDCVLEDELDFMLELDDSSVELEESSSSVSLFSMQRTERL